MINSNLKMRLGDSRGLVLLSVPLWLMSCLSLKQNLKFQEVPATISSVERYIAEEEAKVAGLVRGTNKRISWARGSGVQTEYALVYLPGYSSTRQEIAPVPERVAKVMGMNMFEARFKGNGIDGGGDSYKGVTVQDHLRDAYEALSVGKLIGQKIVLIGTSTGAPFGIWLAHKFPERIAGMVFISPNNEPANGTSNLMLGPFGPGMAKSVTRGYLRGDTIDDPPGEPNEAQRLQYVSQVQHVDAALAMMGIVGIARKINPSGFAVPYLALYSDKDIVVSIKALKSYFKRYGTKTRAPKEAVAVIRAPGKIQHGMVGDLTGPVTTQPAVDVIVAFLKRTLGKPLPVKGEPQDVRYTELKV